MRKTAVVILVLLISLFSFNERELFKKEIRNRLIIQGIGIDRENDGSYSVTLQAINTSAQSSSGGDSGGGGQSPVKIYRVKGDTVYSAVKSASEYEGKVPLYSQNRVIVIGRDTAEKGLGGVLDFFVRDVENSAAVRIAVADGRAEEIMGTVSENGEVIARNIEQSILASEYEPEISELQLYELVDRIKDGTNSFSMPVIALKEEGEKKEKRVEIKETAVFKGEKLSGTVSSDETIMLNFLTNSSYNGALSFDTEDGRTALSIVDSKTRRSVKLENGRPRFIFSLKVQCDIAEIYNGADKSIDREKLSKLEAETEKYIKTETEKVIEKLYKNMECDVPGVSRLIYIKYPSFYRENKKDLSTVMREGQYGVEVKATVRRVGQEFVKIK